MAETLNIKTRTEWRNWLQQNFASAKEVWLVYAKKASGEKRIQYNDAVEEALCFGWIDRTNKTFDQDPVMQRFTPRLPKSSFSQANKERLKWLLDNSLMNKSLIEVTSKIVALPYIFPKDILTVLEKNKTVWANYIIFSEPYKRIRIAYIDGARKRPEEFEKRLANFIKKTKENKLISGYGGIEKYY